MCYSAQVWADFHKYSRRWGAGIAIRDFFNLYWQPSQPGQHGRKPRPKTLRAMDAVFAHGDSDEEHAIAALVEEYDQFQIAQLEHDLFRHKRRKADAERVLQVRATRKAMDDYRIATDKIAWTLAKLSDLRRTDARPKDSRLFPGWYAPVMLMENGRKVVKPMRYQCRPDGKPAFYDREYPGTYNARRDNLERFWKHQFGHTHAIIVVESFYENVRRHTLEGRALAAGEPEENVILHFQPQSGEEMLVACLWSHWAGRGEPDLLSFAAITDDPPPEIAAAGHDRCIIPIKPEHVDAWLQPDASDRDALYAILDDHPRLRYEHRMAA